MINNPCSVEYFQRVRISAVSLLKMVLHARSGGDIEVMGMMYGKLMEHEMIITDVFALPVEGTETRVNAHESANEYLIQYKDLLAQVGRTENVIGWYHSHPGYGCWLSGIDVGTQSDFQTHMDPFLAIVVDPHRTASAGKVDIGAFRTYPESFKASSSSNFSRHSIPVDKVEDFGVHASRYYSVQVSFFKTAADASVLRSLWNQYWMNTLSSSPLLANPAYLNSQMRDVARKVEMLSASNRSSTTSTGATRGIDAVSQVQSDVSNVRLRLFVLC